MILPNKYIPYEDSFVVIGAILLREIGTKKMSTNELWTRVKKIKIIELRFEKYIEILVFMYTTKMITYEKGEIYNENI